MNVLANVLPTVNRQELRNCTLFVVEDFNSEKRVQKTIGVLALLHAMF